MYQVLIVLASVCALACGLSIRLPVAPEDDRIVGGKDATNEEYPYQVSLQYNGKHICGASIVSARHVLTAAHCVVNTSASVLSLRVGSSIREEGGSVHNVSEITVHPQYNSETNDYDVAVLKSTSSFPVGEPGVQAIGLATVSPAAGQIGRISGWGTQFFGSPILPKQLQSGYVPIVDHTDCENSYRLFNDITDRMICAGNKTGGSDTCQGDSGGPLVCNGELVGVVSFGLGCAYPYLYGVYADVASMYVFIISKING